MRFIKRCLPNSGKKFDRQFILLPIGVNVPVDTLALLLQVTVIHSLHVDAYYIRMPITSGCPLHRDAHYIRMPNLRIFLGIRV